MTQFKAVRATDAARMEAPISAPIRWKARQLLAEALTLRPIRFAIMRVLRDEDPREGGALEYRAFAGPGAVAKVQDCRKARKAGVLL